MSTFFGYWIHILIISVGRLLDVVGYDFSVGKSITIGTSKLISPVGCTKTRFKRYEKHREERKEKKRKEKKIPTD